jgi:serine/threonine protein kinase
MAMFACRRDIKPENIFLTDAVRFKLGDLGLAIKADEELPFTRSGTLDYMAPEVQAQPAHELWFLHGRPKPTHALNMGTAQIRKK